MKKKPVNLNALDSIPYPIVIFNNSKTVYLNIEAKKALKIPQKKGDISKLKIDDFVLPEYLKRIKSKNNQILKGKVFPSVELKIRDQRGSIIDVEAKSNAIELDGKKMIQTVFRDISERKRAEKELKESKTTLDLIGKSNTDIIFKFDYYPKEHYSFVSDSAYTILGYKPTDFYKDRSLIRKITHPEDLKKTPTTKKKYIAYIKKNDKASSRYYKKDKTIVWIETIFNVIKDKTGKVVSIIGLSRDVSKEKETEASLNITKEQLSLIANNAHDIIYFYTYQPKPKYLFISNSVEKILGFKPADFYKDPFFINKRTVGKTNEFKEYEKISAKEQLKNKINQTRVKYQVKDANNELIWMEDHVNPVYDDKGKITSLFGIIRNITELKEKEKELDQKWSDYKLLLDQSPIAFFIHLKGVCQMCNKAAVELLKVKSEKKIIGTFIIDYIVSEQRKRALERMHLAASGKEFGFLGYQITDSKKRKINVEIKSVPIRYNGIDCVLSLVKDISERELFEKGKIKAELIEEHNKALLKEIELRKDAERELVGQKNKLSSIFENSSYLVWTIDSKYRLTYFNNNFSKVFKINYGINPEIGKTSYERISGKQKEENKSTWNPMYKKVFNGERVVFERIEKGKNKATIYREVFMNPIFSSSGEIIEIACIANDISEKKQNQNQLIEQSSRINTIFESGNVLLWTVNKEFNYTSFNKNFANALFDVAGEYPKMGYPPGTTRNKKETEIYVDFWIEKYKEVFAGHSSEFVTERKAPDGSMAVRRFYLHPIKNERNEVVEVSIIGNDITNEVFSQKEILSQSAKLSAIFEGSSHYIWTVDKNNNLTSFNKNYTDLIKKIYDTLPKFGSPLNRGKMLFDDDYIKKIESSYHRALGGEKINFELELNGKNNEKVFLDVFLNPVLDNEEIVEVSGIAHDISASKLNEEKIKQSLKEKEVLLKEVHHRVKNNMQIISSILNLQSSYTNDKNILSLLRESQNRIKTMAYIHESLYQNKTFSSINFTEYLTQLISNVVSSYSVSPDKIKLEVNSEKTILNLDTSIPLGLIINELVTNSIKHAFPSTSKGNITINLRTQNKFVLLTVEDNGIGIGPDISPENSGTLGLQLVYTLIDQINGKVSFESTRPHGTRVNIRF